jgi:ABC-2 type transport system permease protein
MKEGNPVLAALSSELRKITTIRAPWLLLATGPLIVVAGISGLIESGGNVSDPATQIKALGHVGLAGIITLVFGIVAVAGEYRHGSIIDSYLSFPGRRRVIVAKLAVYGLFGAAAGLVSSAVALAVTAAWWSAKGGSLQLSAAGTWQTLGGGVAANVGFAVAGVGLGALIRNLAAAIAVALAWIAVVEGIAGELIGSGLARWLPLRASEALGRSSLLGGSQLLSQWAGGLVLLGYAAAFAAAAVVTTLRRDVT